MDYRWDITPYNYTTYQVMALGFLLGDVGHDYTCESAKCWRVTPMAPILCYRKAPPNWYSAAHAYRTRTEAIASLVNYHAQDGGLLAGHRATLRAQVRS